MFKRFQKQFKNNRNADFTFIDSDETSTDGFEPCMKNDVLKNMSESMVNEDVSSSDSKMDDSIYNEGDQKTMRGKYKCTLCANRLLLTDQTLQDHLQSKRHLKREKQWMIKQQKKNTKNVEDKTLEEKETVKEGIQKDFKQKKLLAKKKRVAELTAEQIFAKKEKFRLKKERRLMKKNKEVSL